MVARKIALVTAGGPISAFHAGMARMHQVLEERAQGQYELVGAKGGMTGLEKGEFVPIDAAHLEVNRAGSLIGSDRKVTEIGEVIAAVRRNDIHAIIMMGGDNHLAEAQKLAAAGIRIVGWPKTMDNDLNSHATVGWHTAVKVGAAATRLHHHTAMTCARVFYVGLFGRDTDWVLTGVSAYGGADRAIPAEKEYTRDYVWSKIEASLKANRERYGVEFAVVPYSEGARISGISNGLAHMLDAHGQTKLLAELIGIGLLELTKRAGKEAAFQVHSYGMRDSPPTYRDIQLATMAGEECVAMILSEDFGRAAAFELDGSSVKVVRRALTEVAQKRFVEPTGFFDYDELRVASRFADVYGGFFRAELGETPHKDDLVYANMVPR